MKKLAKQLLASIALFFVFSVANAQDLNGVYFTDSLAVAEHVTEEIKIKDNYFVFSVYETSPAKFLKTMGGFFEVKNDSIHFELEFNSTYENDSLQSLSTSFSKQNGTLKIGQKTFKISDKLAQDLDGPWLFGTRGPDTGQERRGDSRTRKTLKFLLDGRFQWIAFDTKGMQFKGTGGGSYTSVDGKYTENIEYFSRDNARVGASLEFNYELKGNDWHHTGKNSKGEPMYEIWQKRG